MAKKKPINSQNMWLLSILVIVLLLRGQGGLTIIEIPKYIEIPPDELPPGPINCNSLCIAQSFFESGYQTSTGDCNTEEGETTITIVGRPEVCCCIPLEVIEDDEFENTLECRAGCNIFGFDYGECLLEDETPAESGGDFSSAVMIGSCVSALDENCWCWSEGEVSGCYDSDGVDGYEPGYVTDFRGTVYDDCVDDDTVKEYYCKGNSGATQHIDCMEGTSCIEQAGGDYCVAPMEGGGAGCDDTDGGIDIYNRGVCTSEIGSREDHCEFGPIIHEWYCAEDNICHELEYSCPPDHYCSAGKCIILDSDGDGFTDSEEEGWGTNPNDAEDYPREYTNSECYYLKETYDRLHHKIVDNQVDCDEYVFLFCNDAGMTGWLTNFLPYNCCLFDCKPL
jgi:hypothetical protein